MQGRILKLQIERLIPCASWHSADYALADAGRDLITYKEGNSGPATAFYSLCRRVRLVRQKKGAI
jgi:hypothetical protein